jgi:hypothetical protein
VFQFYTLKSAYSTNTTIVKTGTIPSIFEEESEKRQATSDYDVEEQAEEHEMLLNEIEDEVSFSVVLAGKVSIICL